jgi:GNAT superfamily N-acetyltransferase
LIERLDEAAAEPLADLLLDAVAHNASVGFGAELTRAEALAWWRGRLADSHACVVGWRADGGLRGTAQLLDASMPNGRDRGEIAKVIVHSGWRRRGIASALMTALEAMAVTRGKKLLFLDTETGGEAEPLYVALGWVKAGVIPDYAYRPDGVLTPTTFYYKRLTLPLKEVAT